MTKENSQKQMLLSKKEMQNQAEERKRKIE